MSRATFITALGVGQIASWGTLYYSFPLLAIPMEESLGASRMALYLAPTIGLLAGSLGAYPVGAAIDRGWGRAVMAGGAALGALLLMAWSMAESLLQLYIIFVGLGLAQAMTLYDPAFAVVARRYGSEARKGITTLTLWGGFASTVFVPLVQALLTVLSWRDTLMVLAAVNLLLCLPLYGRAIDRRQDATVPTKAPSSEAAPPPVNARWALRQPVFWYLAAAFTLYYGTFSALTYHLYPMLLERGFTAEAVVTAIALIGPAQVAGRLFIWMLVRNASVRAVGGITVAALPVAGGLLLLAEGPLMLTAFALIYGAANGIMTIVRGIAVPELLSREAYGALNGMISVPQTLAKAVAPVAAAMLWSVSGSYQAVIAVTIATTLLVAAFFWAAATYRPRRGRAPLPATSSRP